MAEEETIFHKIINKEIPADILLENDDLIAIKDINPVSPVHILVIPKKTMPSLREAETSDAELLGKMLIALKQIAVEQGLENYRVVINAGEDAGQTVFQLHMHLIGGRELTWPPG